jgi:hypothetical protein
VTAPAWAAVALAGLVAALALAGVLLLHRRVAGLTELVLALMPDDGGAGDLPPPGHRISAFAARTTTGEPLDAAALAAGDLLVGFFLVGCSPCRAQLGAFRELAAGSPRRAVAVVVGADDGDGGYPAELEPVASVVAEPAAALAVAQACAVPGYPAFCLVSGGAVERAAHRVDDLERLVATGAGGRG